MEIRLIAHYVKSLFPKTRNSQYSKNDQFTQRFSPVNHISFLLGGSYRSQVVHTQPFFTACYQDIC